MSLFCVNSLLIFSCIDKIDGIAIRMISSISSTKWKFISDMTVSGILSKSLFFALGKTMCRMLARCAARTFSFMPPTGRMRYSYIC
ncbi:MAG: hypothetical protein R3B45_15520 [Bdellovibrionota bacterium]